MIRAATFCSLSIAAARRLAFALLSAAGLGAPGLCVGGLCVGGLCVGGLGVGGLGAQHGESAADTRPQSAREREAERWVRELELPRNRANAFAQLVRLEERAVPALVEALHDPRSEVGIRAADVLLFLGHRARAALPALADRAANAEPAVAYACRVAHRRLAFRGVVLADYIADAVTIEDAAGTVRQRFETRSVWDAELLVGGKLLHSNYEDGDAFELGRRGNEVWSYTDPAEVYDVDRALDGTTWVTCARLGVVRQVSRTGAVLWESENLGRPVDVEPLPSGRILVTDLDGGRVLEIDREGTVHWQVSDLARPMDADRLTDGTTLIAVSGDGEVRIVDAEGTTVRTIEGVGQVMDADLVRDGCIAVAATSAFRVYDRTDAVIWERDGRYACEIVWALDPTTIEPPKTAKQPGGGGR